MAADKNSVVQLDGSWRLWWGNLIEPSAFTDPALIHTAPDTIAIASYWNDRSHPDNPTQMLPRFGCATFATTVQLPPELQHHPVALRIMGANTAYRIYAVVAETAQLVMGVGDVSCSPETARPGWVSKPG